MSPRPLNAAEGALLLSIARATIRQCSGGPPVVRPDAHWLDEAAAVFVTLTKGGELRGCVGQLMARMPLFEAIRSAALAAAFDDERFPPLRADELADLHIEVSILSPLEPIDAFDEEALLAQLRPGVDGVLLTHSHHSGTFIPEMWKQLPDKRDFLAHLKHKAGLPAAWVPGTRAHRFTAQVWEEP